MVHVILFSGGLDSVTLAYHTLYTKCKEGDTLILHNFLTDELISNAQTNSKIFTIVDDLVGKGADIGVPVHYKNDKLKVEEVFGSENAFVPFRNTLFIFNVLYDYYRLSKDSKYKGVKVYLGAIDNQVEGHGDCTAEFIKAVNDLIKVQFNDDSKMEVIAPFVHLTKFDIILIANSFNVPIEKTWSCLFPSWFEEGNPTPCGECIKCKEREDLGIKI